MSAVRAYHFVGATLRDGRPVPKDGEKLIFRGKPILCKQGLHACLHPFDALQYAPGTILCLVDVGGEVVYDDDKIVGTERTILARIDATELLRYFARMQALSVINLWQAEPPDVVLDWLMTGDESLRTAACVAAWGAWDAAQAAAQVAARTACVAVAWAAAKDAARAARTACVAAAGAAWAAREAADAAARDHFDVLVKESLA